MTENGFVRVVSNPAYHPKAPRPAEAVKRLASLCEDSGHRFWTEDLSLRDAKRFASRLPLGSRQVTEAYLLALAVRHSGMLATFDRGIPLGAVLGATHRSLVLLSA
jgi:predicted nucleic acid-binding protein